MALEPEERVYLGEEPEVLRRVRSNGTRFITWARVRKAPGSKLDEDWFDGAELPLNPQLVAVIGNKGSGKSALLDVLGRLGGTQNMPHCSFLNEEKFRKGDKASHFIGSIEWASGDKVDAPLSTDPERHATEAVRYIPQQFLERLCNEEQGQFELELKAAVFSHIPAEERPGATTLDALVEQQTEAVRRRIGRSQAQLALLNKEIAELEDMRAPEHRRKLLEEVEASRRRLRSHTRTRPREFAPSPDSEGSRYLMAGGSRSMRGGTVVRWAVGGA